MCAAELDPARQLQFFLETMMACQSEIADNTESNMGKAADKQSNDDMSSSEEKKSSDDSSTGAKLRSQQRRRKSRVLFTEEQVKKLEAIFEKQHYVTSTERDELSVQLGMTTNQIKIWFQNRRYKNKRLAQDRSLRMSQISFNPIVGSMLPYGIDYMLYNNLMMGS